MPTRAHPNLLRPLPVPTERFTWDADRRWLIAEASDLPNRGRFERVYSDACDEGLTLISHRTGNEVVCAVHSEVKDDGEIALWVLKPVTSDWKDVFEVHVLND